MAGDDNLQLLRQDLSNQAKSISAIVGEMHEQSKVLRDLETDKAVRAVDRKNLDDRLARIESNIEERDKRINRRMDQLVGLGRWILLGFAVAFVTAAANFIIKGGLSSVGP